MSSLSAGGKNNNDWKYTIWTILANDNKDLAARWSQNTFYDNKN